MDASTETILVMAAALPAAYGIACWICRVLNAKRTAEWVKEYHPNEWNGLHWLAQRNAWAGVEVLITKGVISGPGVEAYRSRDEYLEKRIWLGLFISALLLLGILVLKYVLSLKG